MLAACLIEPGALTTERLKKMMNPRNHTLRTAACVTTVAAFLVSQCSATDNAARRCWTNIAGLSAASATPVCADPSAGSQVKQALRSICLESPITEYRPTNQRAIVIGFLGGFAKRDDLDHPEVWFAKYLREHYAPAIDAATFSNHNANAALHFLIAALDTDCDGTLSVLEKENARIILYGHSWGGIGNHCICQKIAKVGYPGGPDYPN